MPTTHHSQNAKIYSDGYAIQAWIRKLKLAMAALAPENTTIGATGAARTREADGHESGNIEYDGIVTDLAAGSDARMKALFNQSSKIWTIMPFDDAAVGTAGYGLVTVKNKYDRETDGEDVIVFAGSGVISGYAERLKALHPLAARTADGDGTTLDNAAATTVGGSAYIHLTAATALTSLIVIIEGSATGAFAGEETTIATFATLTAAPGRERIVIAGTIPRYLRASWDITGTSATFFVGVHRARRAA